MPIALFDGHCDTISALGAVDSLWRNSGHFDLERAGKYAPRAQFFALWHDCGKDAAKGGYNTYIALRDRFMEESSRHVKEMTLCRSASEARLANEEQKLTAFLAVEGAELLECSPAKLAEAVRDGVRMVTLTWNYDNLISGSAAGSGEGLSPLGRAFVSRMHDLGVIADVSHLSDKGFWDVCALSKECGRPFIASHSNARALCAHRRNLTDEMFGAVRDSGGVAGLNLYVPFLTRSGRCTLDTAADHIIHFLMLDGEDALSLGCDFDGCDELPEGVGGVQDMEKLYEVLLRRGISQMAADKIFYYNLMRVVEKTCSM